MSVTFECGDKNALVAYLYEECEPELRDVISGHLTRCDACSSEIDGLGWTRGHLEMWAPPMPELGFRMQVPTQEARLPWWRAPLPAWAQAAAALVIFGVGLSVGLARGPVAAPQVASNQPPPATMTTTPTTVTASRNDLSQLEERLKSQIAQIRTAVPVRQVVSSSSSSDEEIMQKVEALLAQSEERQRREFTLRSVEMARDFEAQRRIDMASVREAVGQFQGVTGNEIRQQREAIDRINSLIRVSQQGR
jgi:hypothetical protein